MLVEDNADIIVNWDIVNFSCLWGNEDMTLHFVANLIENSEWEMNFRPNKVLGRNYVSCALETTKKLPEITNIDFEIAFLDEDGNILKMDRREGIYFFPGGVFRIEALIEEDDLLVTRKEEFLPKDILRTRLKMWRQDIKTLSSVEMFAVSYAQAETHAFVWDIKDFSYVQSYQEISHTCELIFLEGKIIFKFSTPESETEEISIDISYETKEKKNLFLRFDIVDSKGHYLNCGMKKFCFSSIFEDYSYFLPLSRMDIWKKTDLYLTKDILSLMCRYTICKGSVSSIITKVDVNNVSSKLVNPSSRILQVLNSRQQQAKFRDGLRKGLTALYKERMLCDIQLQTETETFPAHSVVLSALSPVFRTILTEDFEKKAERCVKITDFDADTVRRMLMYIYTDSVPDLRWEDALKLRMAADKYKVISLQRKCLFFLMDNINANNFCDVLCFATLHQDKDLKKNVQVFILKYAKVIMKTNEWKQLMETNPTLAAETMYMYWKKDWNIDL